jgi:hypothetical protein
MAKKNKVPKRIAGAKLPKALRRGLRDLAATQEGRAALGEALAAAGAALAGGEAQPPSKTPRAAKPGPKVKGATDASSDQAPDTQAATVAAFESAARAFTQALRREGGTATSAPTTTGAAAPTPPSSASTH